MSIDFNAVGFACLPKPVWSGKHTIWACCDFRFFASNIIFLQKLSIKDMGGFLFTRERSIAIWWRSRLLRDSMFLPFDLRWCVCRSPCPSGSSQVSYPDHEYIWGPYDMPFLACNSPTNLVAQSAKDQSVRGLSVKDFRIFHLESCEGDGWPGVSSSSRASPGTMLIMLMSAF